MACLIPFEGHVSTSGGIGGRVLGRASSLMKKVQNQREDGFDTRCVRVDVCVRAGIDACGANCLNSVGGGGLRGDCCLNWGWGWGGGG
jgi:hypothetical protein